MRETELKAVVDDLAFRRSLVEQAGATLVFAGALEDTRYDTADRTLSRDDIVLRLRVYRTAAGTTAHLDWKGPSAYDSGFKVREELSTSIDDPAVLATILRNLGYTPERCIDREIAQYDLHGTMVRFEQYPELDVLVEVEGDIPGIEAAIQVIGLPRETFTTKRLVDFVADYEVRTGRKAVVGRRTLG